MNTKNILFSLFFISMGNSVGMFASASALEGEQASRQEICLQSQSQEEPAFVSQEKVSKIFYLDAIFLGSFSGVIFPMSVRMLHGDGGAPTKILSLLLATVSSSLFLMLATTDRLKVGEKRKVSAMFYEWLLTVASAAIANEITIYYQNKE